MHTKTTVIKEYLLYLKTMIPELKYRIFKPGIINQLFIDGKMIIYCIDNFSVVKCINYINEYIKRTYNIPVYFNID